MDRHETGWYHVGRAWKATMLVASWLSLQADDTINTLGSPSGGGTERRLSSQDPSLLRQNAFISALPPLDTASLLAGLAKERREGSFSAALRPPADPAKEQVAKQAPTSKLFLGCFPWPACLKGGHPGRSYPNSPRPSLGLYYPPSSALENSYSQERSTSSERRYRQRGQQRLLGEEDSISSGPIPPEFWNQTTDQGFPRSISHASSSGY